VVCYDPPTAAAEVQAWLGPDVTLSPQAEGDLGHRMWCALRDGLEVARQVCVLGTDVPDLVGWYVFGDFGSGRIFAIPENSAAGVTPDELLDTTHGIVTFATGEDGELYFADYFVGTIHKIEAAP
jgi:hypothetical protein